MTDPRNAVIEAIREKLKGVAAPPWFPDWDKHTATAALDAMLGALPGLGLTQPTWAGGSVDMVAAFWRRKNGHHYHDEPPPIDTSDMAAIRDALAAAPSPLAEEPQP